MFIGLKGEIRETRVLLPREQFPHSGARGPLYPNSRWIDSVVHSVFTFFHIWFSQNQILNNLPLDFDKMETSKKRERKYFQT